MSAWSGIAVGAIVLVLAFVVVGQPLYEWRYTQPSAEETWSYGAFGATHTNTTTGTSAAYPYPNVPGQPDMAAAFQSYQLWFLLSIVGTLAGIALSAVNLAKRLRGLYAGVAFLGSCGAILFATLDLILTVPRALGDLPTIGGQPLAQFQGTLQASGAGWTLAWGPALGWYLCLAAAVALAWGASDLWGLPSGKVVPKTAVVRRAAPLPPPPPPEPAPVREEPIIEEVFVIAPNGLLVKHMSRSLMSDKDRDVVGGMISVVSNFVRESFSEHDGGSVQEVTLGANRFIIANDRGLVAAALVQQGTKEDVEHRLFHLLACLHDRYGDRLERWGGEPLEGLEDEIQVLWEPFFVPPPPAD